MYEGIENIPQKDEATIHSTVIDFRQFLINI